MMLLHLCRPAARLPCKHSKRAQRSLFRPAGALKRAAEVARGGAPVGCSIVESFGKEVKPRELEEVLRLEYRSKLLNPKWAQAMAAQGSGGAYEISQRMTAAVGTCCRTLS